MNDHTHRLLERMRSLLGQYDQDKISLRFLVDSLEENFNTLEERLPENFYSGWFSHWGKLEVILAMKVEGLSPEDENSAKVLDTARALENLIQTVESLYHQP